MISSNTLFLCLSALVALINVLAGAAPPPACDEDKLDDQCDYNDDICPPCMKCSVLNECEFREDYVPSAPTTTTTTTTYCASSGTTSYEWINRVKVDSLDHSSASGSGYADFTDIVTVLTEGTVVSVVLTPGFSQASYSEYWKIWIDVNGDGDFDDSGEEVFSGSGSSTVSGSFTVPTTIVAIVTRMRVSMEYSSYPPMCGSFTYGEVEDYTVDIRAKSSKSNGVGGTSTININSLLVFIIVSVLCIAGALLICYGYVCYKKNKHQKYMEVDISDGYK